MKSFTIGLSLLVALLATSSGCDKLKGSVSGDGDGGAGATSGGLSFLGGGDFEGEISMNMTSAKQKQKAPVPIVFGIKKPKYRIDITQAIEGNPQLAGGAAVILDPPTKKGYMLVHSQKMAMLLDFDKMKASGGLPGMPRPGGATAPGKPSTPPKIEKTGKKEVIAGYTCEIWIATTEKSKSDICVAEGITWIDLTDIGWASPEVAAASAISGANHFPLRVIAYDTKGAEEFRMEATKVEKKSLDEARFIVPNDYRIVDPAAMMGGFGKPGAPGGPGAPGVNVPKNAF